VSTETTYLGGHSKALRPFTMKNVRKLPIVGDVYCGRKQWPSASKDWEDLLSIRPLPIKLTKIIYSVNEEQ